jgi:hypothetical protein
VHAVVIDRLPADVGALAKAAADVLGATAYDVRASMNVPGGGPAVLSTFADPGRAEETRAALQRAGFAATVVPVGAVPARIDVRRFEFRGGVLAVEDRTGTRQEVHHAEVDLLLRASAVTTTSTTKVVNERKFSPVRSVLSGGLVNTSVQRTKKTTRSTDSDELLIVYRGEHPPLRMSEHGLQYQGLGAALQPSRMANFRFAVDELRRRCPQAPVDERLRQRAVQSQVLGRTLSPDDHLDFAIELVAASARARLRGYR